MGLSCTPLGTPRTLTNSTITPRSATCSATTTSVGSLSTSTQHSSRRRSTRFPTVPFGGPTIRTSWPLQWPAEPQSFFRATTDSARTSPITECSPMSANNADEVYLISLMGRLRTLRWPRPGGDFLRVVDALCPDNLEYSLLLTDIVQLDVYVGSGLRGPTGDLFAGSRSFVSPRGWRVYRCPRAWCRARHEQRRGHALIDADGIDESARSRHRSLRSRDFRFACPGWPFIHPRAAEPTRLCSSHHRPGPNAVTPARADVSRAGGPCFQGIPSTPLLICVLAWPSRRPCTRRASACRDR